VKAPFSLFLALRYLKPKRTFVSVITLISILGVTLGIAILIIVISVMTGFHRELQRTILGFESHLTVASSDYLETWREAADQIAAAPGIVAVSPFVQGPVLVEFGGRSFTPVIRAIDLERERKIVDFSRFIVAGEARLESDTVLIGSMLAQELGVTVGDTITVYAPGNMHEVFRALRSDDPEMKAKTLEELKNEVILPAELKVAGIFESQRQFYDATFLIVPLHIGQELFLLQDAVHGLSVQTTSPDAAAPMQAELLRRLPPELSVRTWYDANRDRLDAVQIERSVMFFILMALIVIAAFGITSTLITVTVQKTREIGILKALGATASQIVWVFLAQGMFVGFVGNLIGLGLGRLVIEYRNPFKDWLSATLGIQLFPPTIYEFKGIPAEIVGRDVAVICVSAFVICSVAALIPAYFAARLDPVKALRYE
jgi:lipoprotein-releasing system permease protein